VGWSHTAGSREILSIRISKAAPSRCNRLCSLPPPERIKRRLSTVRSRPVGLKTEPKPDYNRAAGCTHVIGPGDFTVIYFLRRGHHDKGGAIRLLVSPS
jgi:hypothetical protein